MTKYVNDNGVSEMWLNIKNWVTSQLLGKSNTGHTHTKSEVTDFPTLATVATSGSYNDLSNKPTIPTKTSDLSNDSGFITKDATKIPLAGTNAITGIGFFKSTNNSQLQIGSGTSTSTGGCFVGYGSEYSNSTVAGAFRIRAISGNTSYDLLGYANGTLTWGSKIVDTIEEQGNGYIRYSNGLQICWGSIEWQSACSTSWGSLYETSAVNESYAKSFVGTPSVSASGNVGAKGGVVETSGGSSTKTPTFYLCRGASMTEVNNCTVRYIAIGRWK